MSKIFAKAICRTHERMLFSERKKFIKEVKKADEQEEEIDSDASWGTVSSASYEREIEEEKKNRPHTYINEEGEEVQTHSSAYETQPDDDEVHPVLSLPDTAAFAVVLASTRKTFTAGAPRVAQEVYCQKKTMDFLRMSDGFQFALECAFKGREWNDESIAEVVAPLRFLKDIRFYRCSISTEGTTKTLVSLLHLEHAEFVDEDFPPSMSVADTCLNVAERHSNFPVRMSTIKELHDHSFLDDSDEEEEGVRDPDAFKRDAHKHGLVKRIIQLCNDRSLFLKRDSETFWIDCLDTLASFIHQQSSTEVKLAELDSDEFFELIEGMIHSALPSLRVAACNFLSQIMQDNRERTELVYLHGFAKPLIDIVDRHDREAIADALSALHEMVWVVVEDEYGANTFCDTVEADEGSGSYDHEKAVLKNDMMMLQDLIDLGILSALKKRLGDSKEDLGSYPAREYVSDDESDSNYDDSDDDDDDDSDDDDDDDDEDEENVIWEDDDDDDNWEDDDDDDDDDSDDESSDDEDIFSGAGGKKKKKNNNKKKKAAEKEAKRQMKLIKKMTSLDEDDEYYHPDTSSSDDDEEEEEESDDETCGGFQCKRCGHSFMCHTHRIFCPKSNFLSSSDDDEEEEEEENEDSDDEDNKKKRIRRNRKGAGGGDGDDSSDDDDDEKKKKDTLRPLFVDVIMIEILGMLSVIFKREVMESDILRIISSKKYLLRKGRKFRDLRTSTSKALSYFIANSGHWKLKRPTDFVTSFGKNSSSSLAESIEIPMSVHHLVHQHKTQQQQQQKQEPHYFQGSLDDHVVFGSGGDENNNNNNNNSKKEKETKQQQFSASACSSSPPTAAAAAAAVSPSSRELEQRSDFGPYSNPVKDSDDDQDSNEGNKKKQQQQQQHKDPCTSSILSNVEKENNKLKKEQQQQQQQQQQQNKKQDDSSEDEEEEDDDFGKKWLKEAEKEQKLGSGGGGDNDNGGEGDDLDLLLNQLSNASQQGQLEGAVKMYTMMTGDTTLLDKLMEKKRKDKEEEEEKERKRKLRKKQLKKKNKREEEKKEGEELTEQERRKEDRKARKIEAIKNAPVFKNHVASVKRLEYFLEINAPHLLFKLASGFLAKKKLDDRYAVPPNALTSIYGGLAAAAEFELAECKRRQSQNNDDLPVEASFAFQKEFANEDICSRLSQWELAIGQRFDVEHVTRLTTRLVCLCSVENQLRERKFEELSSDSDDSEHCPYLYGGRKDDEDDDDDDGDDDENENDGGDFNAYKKRFTALDLD